MKTFGATIDIAATPDAVWAVLVDLGRWPTFDPYCERINGEAGPGRSITVYSKLAPGRAFPLAITTFDQPHQMAWTGGVPLGMLKNVRTHTITPQDSGSRFEVTEVISGPMLSIITKVLPDLTEPFDAFCKGLKSQAEAQQ